MVIFLAPARVDVKSLKDKVKGMKKKKTAS